MRVRPTDDSNPVRTIDVAGLFIAIGHDPNTTLFAGQLALDKAIS